jgi:hypothetical protein
VEANVGLACRVQGFVDEGAHHVSMALVQSRTLFRIAL